jgi:hypothetical protein
MRLAQTNNALQAAAVDASQIRFEPINDEAMEASHLWGDDATLFPWEDVHGWKQTDHRGIDIALWYDIELCGMAYASPRQSKLCIKVILLEGKPDRTHPLKGFVAPLVLDAIESYALLIGCSEIEMEEPASGAVAWYETLGFAFDQAGRLVMAVQR